MALARITLLAIYLMLPLLDGLSSGADEKPTSIATAAAAVEANMKTRAGKAYDAQLGKDLGTKYPPIMKACKEKAQGDVHSFDMLVRVGANGFVKEVLLFPPTKISQCLRTSVLNDTFSPPPRPDYWVDIHIDVKPAPH